MSDPIKKILTQLDKEMAAAVAVGSGKGLGNYDNAIKQIRQQIGWELLQFEHVMTERGINNVYDIFYVTSNKINEVCQLEEE